MTTRAFVLSAVITRIGLTYAWNATKKNAYAVNRFQRVNRSRDSLRIYKVWGQNSYENAIGRAEMYAEMER